MSTTSASPRSVGGSPPDRAPWVRAASTARRSTTSFISSPLWPLTHSNVISSRRARYRPISGFHRSWFLTGSFFAFFQSRRSQPSYQRCLKQSTTYLESLTMRRGPSMARIASSAACTSIRWFVVAAAEPLANAPPGTAHAHPPGPGFPMQAPSV